MSRKKRRQSKVEEIDITSLLDILVILLVFLLKSFNDSELSVEIANELSLPYSLSRAAGNSGTILQVNKTQDVYINSEVIGNLNNSEIDSKLVGVLKAEYTRRSEKSNNALKGYIINFVFDKELEYKVINRIMSLSSKTGFNKYKLIIQGEE